MKFDFRKDFGLVSDRGVSLSLLEDCNSGGAVGLMILQHKLQNLYHPQIASPLHV